MDEAELERAVKRARFYTDSVAAATLEHSLASDVLALVAEVRRLQAALTAIYEWQCCGEWFWYYQEGRARGLVLPPNEKTALLRCEESG